MDPLSITAGILAVIGAAKGVVSGINKAREFKHCPDELRDLRNRLITHTAFLELSRPTFESIGSYIELDTAEGLNAQLEYSAGQLLRVQQLIERVMRNVQGSSSAKPNMKFVAWVRYRDEIERLKKALVEDRQALSDVLVALNSQWTFAIADIAVSVDNPSALRQSNEKDPEAVSPIVESTDTGLPAYSETASATLDTPASRSTKALLSHGSLGRGEVHVAATLRRNACSMRCPCHCHIQTHLGTPSQLRVAVGYLLYSYTGQSIVRPHDEDCGCLMHHTSYHRLLYIFPTWAFRYALSLTCTFGSLTGPGASWSVKLPRQLPSGHAVWSAIEENNVSVFRTMLTERSISFYDIDGANQETFLDYAVRTQASDISELLLLQGADMHDESSSPVSVIARLAINKLCGGPDSERCGYATLSSDTPQDALGLNCLHRAVLGLEPVKVQSLLEKPVQSININERDSVGNTALMWAVSTRNALLVDTLLDYGADPKWSRLDGHTALHEAAEWGNYDVIRKLVLNGADVHATNMNRRTALHLASERMGQVDAIQILLDKGANVNALDAWGKTSLHRCCTFGDLPGVECMLGYGADIDIKTSESTDDGRTPLILAIQHDKADIAHLLIRQEAQTKTLTANRRTVLHFAALYANAHTIHVLQAAYFGDLLPIQEDEWGYSAFEVLYRRKKGEYPDLRPFTDEIEVACLRLLLKACLDRDRAHGLDKKELKLLELCTDALEHHPMILMARASKAGSELGTDDGEDVYFDVSESTTRFR